MADSISSVASSNQDIANLVQIYAMKKVQQNQMANTLALISSSAAPKGIPPTPSLPSLGANVDISV